MQYINGYICRCLALFFIFVFIRLLEYQILQFHTFLLSQPGVLDLERKHKYNFKENELL